MGDLRRLAGGVHQVDVGNMDGGFLRDKDRVVVEGVNMVSKHTKPNPQQPQGGIVKKEAPIHISNVNLMDAAGKPTKIAHKVVDGKKVRIAKSTGEEIK